MKILITFSIFILLFLPVSCKYKQVMEEETSEQIQIHDEVKQLLHEEWKVIGTEPFWSLKIKNDTVLYTRVNEKIDSVFLSLLSSDENKSDTTFSYVFSDPYKQKLELSLLKSITPCSDGMSDNRYEYYATVTYKTDTLKGCAEKK